MEAGAARAGHGALGLGCARHPWSLSLGRWALYVLYYDVIPPVVSADDADDPEAEGWMWREGEPWTLAGPSRLGVFVLTIYHTRVLRWLLLYVEGGARRSVPTNDPFGNHVHFKPGTLLVVRWSFTPSSLGITVGLQLHS